MDLRIGIAESSQIVEIEVSDDTDRKKLKDQVTKALAGSDKVLWLQDHKGKEVAIAAEQVSFVEIGTSSKEQRIGFGA